MRLFLQFSIPGSVPETLELAPGDKICLSSGQLAISKNPDAIDAAFSVSLDNRVLSKSGVRSLAGKAVDEGSYLEIGKTYVVSNTRFRIDSIPEKPVFNRRSVERIPLKSKALVFGANGSAAGVSLEILELTEGDLFEILPFDSTGWKFERKDFSGKVLISKNGESSPELLNGVLIYGDIIRVGDYCFEYQVSCLRLVDSSLGSWLDADAVSVIVGNNITILDEASLQINPGNYYGVLGGSGQGKSTLLNCISGSSPASRGQVLLDGEPVTDMVAYEPGSVGYVPQDDIVHRELRVIDALFFAARLRLPGGLPKAEIHRLIGGILEKLSLTEHSEKKVGKLSGGQRKRVSIASELLSRPSILFLDEPTSGLDPATEQDVMKLLKNTSKQVCPVVCTTHILGESYLFDEIFFINRAKIVFRGKVHDACPFFGVKTLTEIYRKLADQAEKKEEVETHHESKPRQLPKADEARIERISNQPGLFSSIITLLARQAKILGGSKFDVCLLAFQAVALGCLIGWGVENVIQRSFLLILASIWFGCSNASQTIVKELEVLRRECLAGLSTHAYLLSKVSFWTLITGFQVLLFWIVVQGVALITGNNQASLSTIQKSVTGDLGSSGELFGNVLGAVAYYAQIGEYVDSYKPDALASAIGVVFGLKFAIIFVGSLVGVSIGLLISSSVRSIVSAVLMVPVIILPQIPLSGSMINLPDMSPLLRFVSFTTPCGQLKQIGDGAEIFGMQRPKVLNFTDDPVYVREKQQSGSNDGEEAYEIHPMSNAWINAITDPDPEKPHVKLIRKGLDNSAGVSSVDMEDTLRENSVYEIFHPNRSDVRLGEGQYFVPSSYAVFGYSFLRSFLVLAVWVIGCYFGSIFFIKINAK